MDNTRDDLKNTIDQLAEQVRSLAERVDELERGVNLATGFTGSPMPAPSAPSAAAVEEVSKTVKESALSVGGVAALMSRGSVISLILLFALVLRILTDNEVLGLGFGTALGIGYAALLEGLGWLMYRVKSTFAPIFSISGALLLAAVVLETHSVFGSISLVPAYILLATAGGVMAILSRQYNAGIPVSVGTVAVLVAAVPIGLQDGNFTAIAIFLIAINTVAFTSVNLPRTSWLRIVTCMVTIVVIMLWGYKLRYAILTGLESGSGTLAGGPALFYTIVIFYAFFYFAFPAIAIWKSESEKNRPFDHILPSLTSAWAYLACLMIVNASGANVRILGVAGVGAATCLLALAAVKGSRTGAGSRGTTTFAFPAAVLLALSFRDVSGQSVAALAILSWAALSLAWLSARWSSAGVRVTGYFLQATVLGASFLLLVFSPAGKTPLATVMSMTAVTVIAFAHYKLTRSTEPPGPNEWFTRLDKADIGGILPLLVSVGAASFAVRALLFSLAGSSPWIFAAGETVIINTGALALFAAARLRRNAEFKWVAVLVTAVGGGKVFLYDLFQIKGVPVVVSVLSFVLAAAFGSWVLSRWQRMDQSPDK